MIKGLIHKDIIKFRDILVKASDEQVIYLDKWLREELTRRGLTPYEEIEVRK